MQNANRACTVIAAAAPLPTVIDEQFMRLMEVVMDWLALNIYVNTKQKSHAVVKYVSKLNLTASLSTVVGAVSNSSSAPPELCTADVCA